jgi:hypothetical protein
MMISETIVSYVRFQHAVATVNAVAGVLIILTFLFGKRNRRP